MLGVALRPFPSTAGIRRSADRYLQARDEIEQCAAEARAIRSMIAPGVWEGPAAESIRMLNERIATKLDSAASAHGQAGQALEQLAVYLSSVEYSYSQLVAAVRAERANPQPVGALGTTALNGPEYRLSSLQNAIEHRIGDANREVRSAAKTFDHYATDIRYDMTGAFFRTWVDEFGNFLSGAIHGILIDPVVGVVDLLANPERIVRLVEYLLDDPTGFGRELVEGAIDLEQWNNDPSYAAGQLGGPILVGLLTGGAGALLATGGRIFKTLNRMEARRLVRVDPGQPWKKASDFSPETADRLRGIDRGDGRDVFGKMATDSARRDAADKQEVGLLKYESQNPGSTVLRDDVGARIHGLENLRRYDGLVRNSDGTYTGIEVKSGSSPVTDNQLIYDKIVSPEIPARATLKNGEEVLIVKVEYVSVP